MLYILNSVSFDLSKIDSQAITVFIVGYTVVFSALVLLYFVFSSVPKLLNIKVRQRLRNKGMHETAEANDTELQISADVNAAICTALHLYYDEQHDEETGVLTLKRVSKRYSPWSSKIYGVMNNRLN